MKRRTFFAATAATAAATTLGSPSANAQGNDRMVFELRKFTFSSNGKAEAFSSFLKAAAIPAANRAGIEKVGVFRPESGDAVLYVLIPHKSIDSVLTMMPAIQADEGFQQNGAAVIDAPASDPAFDRIESRLLLAFTGMPGFEVPASSPDRVFQLRTYASPSFKTGAKKIEMFNLAEIDIFRKSGMNPVFFGQTIIGDNIPNLTYMLGFDNQDALKKGWKTFVSSPEWKELSAKPEYADDKILSGIDNVVVLPTEASQF